MLNVGLTGGIACGKSTVAKMLVDCGAHLIDFDLLAHNVQEPGKPAWQKVVDFFGRNILLPDGKIDRIKLGNIVFADPDKIRQLNEIVHPFVYQEWGKRLEKIVRKENHAIVLSDVPLLFEGKKQHLFDLTLLILVEPEEQIRRLMARNHISREEAQKRLNSQMPIAKKKELADRVIDNRGSMAATGKLVKKIWRELMSLEKRKSKRESSDVKIKK